MQTRNFLISQSNLQLEKYFKMEAISTDIVSILYYGYNESKIRSNMPKQIEDDMKGAHHQMLKVNNTSQNLEQIRP